MKYYNTILKISVLALSIGLFSNETNAQTSTLSPYSIYGLGDIQSSDLAQSKSMGFAGTALLDKFVANTSNPASYPSLTLPVFQFGLSQSFATVSSATGSSENSAMGVDYFNLTMPVKNKWGISLGLAPYSTRGYDINELDSIPNVGNVDYQYKGDGGLSKAFLGLGRNIVLSYDTIDGKAVKAKQLNIGVNQSYLFGALNTTRKVVFEDDSYMNTKITDKNVLRGFNTEIGLIYKQRKSDKLDIVVAATYGLGTNLNSTIYSTSQNFWFTSVEIERDTADYQKYKGTVSLPQKWSLGMGFDIHLKKDKELKVLVDVKGQDWSNFNSKYEGSVSTGSMVSSSSLGLGVEYTPAPYYKTNQGFFKRTNYRAGYYSSATQLKLNGEQLKKTGITFGLGLPVSNPKVQTLSKINLGIELGKRGTTDNNLLEEEYLNISIGLSLTPWVKTPWFVQRKYD